MRIPVVSPLLALQPRLELIVIKRALLIEGCWVKALDHPFIQQLLVLPGHLTQLLNRRR